MEKFGNEGREGNRVRNKITEPCEDNMSKSDAQCTYAWGEEIRDGVRPVLWPRHKHWRGYLDRVWLSLG